MTWTEDFRGEGKFTLITHDTDKYAEILRHGWYFYRTDRKIAMMAVKVERDTDKNTITVCGYSTLHLLSRRIIDLPVKCTNVEEGIYEIINGDLRGLPNVECAPAKGLTDECDFEIEGEPMLDAVFSLLGESSYGIRANFDHVNKKHVIEVYDGVDRTYDSDSGGTVFSQEFGNLHSLIATEDDDIYKNVAYVTGSSSNDPRTVYYQYVSPDAGEQENWREIIVSGENQEEDESTADWQARQKQIGIEALQACKNALSFEVELGLGVFGKKYDLGDKVTCKSKRYGLQFDTQIMEYQYSYKQGAESVTVVLGDRPLDYVQSSIIKSSSGGASAKLIGGGSGSGTPGKDGVSCTHNWNGSVLTVTSASGTSSADLLGPKGDKGDTGQPGASGVGYNLLDNSDFTNPVNQRGLTEYANAGYTIDRWKWTYPTETRKTIVNEGSVTLINTSSAIGYFIQKFEDALKEGVYTIALQRNGEILCRAVNTAQMGTGQIVDIDTLGSLYIDVGLESIVVSVKSGSTIDGLEWIALYEGEYTADTLPPYVQKGYVVELAECQRYFYRAAVGSSSSVIPGFTLSDTTARATIITPQQMRIAPSITVNTVGNINVYTGNEASYATAISLHETKGNNVVVLVTAEGLTAWRSCVVRFNTRIDLSADL